VSVNKKSQGALRGGNFIDAEAEVLFTFCIVLRKSGLADSSIPTAGLMDLGRHPILSMAFRLEQHR